MRAAPPTATEALRPSRGPAALRVAALLAVTVAAALAYATDWQSPVRVALVLVFMLFVPGLALAEALAIREPAQQLALAVGASLAVETLVGLSLLYAGVFSVSLILAIVAALTCAASAAALVRAPRPDRFAP